MKPHSRVIPTSLVISNSGLKQYQMTSAVRFDGIKYCYSSFNNIYTQIMLFKRTDKRDIVVKSYTKKFLQQIKTVLKQPAVKDISRKSPCTYMRIYIHTYKYMHSYYIQKWTTSMALKLLNFNPPWKVDTENLSQNCIQTVGRL